MKSADYRFNLDVHDTASQAVLSMRKGDSARRFLITLSEDGKPYRIADGSYAVFNAVRADGAVYFGDCVISGGVIIHELGKNMGKYEGRIDCDITLYDADGEALTSPRFSIIVYAGVASGDVLEATDEYRTLGELVGDSKKLNDELHGLKDGIADELEKANDTIDGFNEWYGDAKTELSALTEETEERCDNLTAACDEKIAECGKTLVNTDTACKKLISDTDAACDKLISDTDAECDALKKEVETSMAEYTSVGTFVTVPADAWSDDTDLLSTQRVQRVAYRISSTGSSKDIIEHNWNASTDAILTENWQTFEASFVFSPTDSTDRLYLMFYGGKSASFCHPYDIADVKLWLASDTEHTNLLPEDIAKLNWWWHYDTGTCPEVNRFSVAYEDGSKYIHVWRQKAFTKADGKVEANLAYLRAGTGVKLTKGETYTLSMRMRTTCSRHTCIVPLDGIRAHSSTIVTPVPESAVSYGAAGVRAFGERIGELMFVCESVPTDDLVASVAATCGEGGAILNCAPAHTEGGGTVVTGSYVGDGSGEATLTISAYISVSTGEASSSVGYASISSGNSYSPRTITFPFVPKVLMICSDNESIVFTKATESTYNVEITKVTPHGYSFSNDGAYAVSYSASCTTFKYSGNKLELYDLVNVDIEYEKDSADLEVNGERAGGSYTVDVEGSLNKAGMTYHWIAW